MFALAYLLIPPLSVVRYPVKLLVPFVMLLAILAGSGLDALYSAEIDWRDFARRLVKPLYIFLGCVVIVFAVAWLVPMLEVAVAIGLCLAGTRPFAAALAIVVLLTYAAAIAVNLGRGRRDLACGCGGPNDRRPIAACDSGPLLRKGFFAALFPK